jgi:para-aminobenzoate synthetase / 4-amino-4-deoxychorismate lyase
MIVDMMRNDLGRIARTGTVRTTRLFELERLPTVWQMTSTIEAETDAGLDAIFAALFPCASVTGAPKVRTMHLIRQLEASPRGLYTGAIGIAGPGRRAQFNVAIRTLYTSREDGQSTYPVGSGIVWDSDPAREFAECRAKALVLAGDREFDVITTLRWEPGAGCLLWPRHLVRGAHAPPRVGRGALASPLGIQAARARPAAREGACAPLADPCGSDSRRWRG